MLDAQEAHLAKCAVCRERQMPNFAKGEATYAVKNRVTREYLHVIAASSSNAIRQLGWSEADTVAIVTNFNRDAEGKKKMPEHIKARLKALSKQKRKAEATARRQAREAAKARGDIDTMGKACYTTSRVNKLNTKGGENNMSTETLATWVKTFIDGQITTKNDKGKDVTDMDALFDLAKVNDVDQAKINRYKKDLEPENAGRIRMTVGNMIRGAASKNGKLLTIGGASKIVPDGLVPAKKEKAPKAAKKAKGKKAA